MRKRTMLFALAVLLAGQFCAPAKAPAPAPAPPKAAAAVYPGAEWERIADPEQAGWSKDGLAAALAHIQTMPTTGLVVVAGGRVLLEHGDVVETNLAKSKNKPVAMRDFLVFVDKVVAARVVE